MALLVLSATLALLALVLFSYAFGAFGRGRVFGGLGRILVGIILVGLGLLAALLSLGVRGYQALTSEQLAATVTVQKTAPQRFRAEFMFPDGEQKTFELAGEEILVDAHIIKWHPWANILGLQTAYKLDRVSGRYSSIDDEQTEARTVYSLGQDNPVNLLELSKRLNIKPLLDAEYGSGTFVPVEDQSSYTIMVSSTGLLVRKVPE
jgi:hypothetical protein